MFSGKPTTPSTERFSAQTARLRRALETADAVVVGAGAGLSAAAGLAYDGERFERLFADFREAYGFTDMYTGGFYPYETPEAYWAWWSRHILANRYDVAAGEPYLALLRLLRDKDYFVLTTNVDHQFRLAGFPKARLFYTQGDYGLWQCAAPCHDGTYDNEAAVRAMAASQRGLRVPAALLPRCPVCGGPMTMNLRCDERFVQDEGWYAAAGRCEAFLRRLRGRRVLFLELGVGANTPAVIKFPFWRMTAANPDAVYACVNLDFACCPAGITARSLCIRADISAVLAALASLSLGALGGYPIFGKNLFDGLDFLTANILLPLGGLATSLFVGWHLDKRVIRREMTNEGSLRFRIFGLFLFLLRSRFLAVGGLFVFPVCSDTIFCSSVHFISTDLDFKGLSVRSDQCGMQ